jgi:hypothetical protein
VPSASRHGIAAHETYSNGVWNVSLVIPLDHQYIWLSTAHCNAHIASVAISPREERNYAVALAPGASTDLDERDALVMGTLPFAGVASVDLVSLSNVEGEVQKRHAVLNGKHYYIENVPAGTYTVKVTLVNGGYVYLPATTFSKSHPFAPFALTVNVSIMDLAHLLHG